MTLYLSNEDQAALLEWARPRCRLSGVWPDTARALGVLDEKTDEIKAVLVTVEIYAGIIDAHFASDNSRRWATRNILGGLFGYLFFVRKAKRVQTLTSPQDSATTVMNYKLGFRFEATLQAAMDDGGEGTLMGMTPATCKWIKEDTHG